MLFNAHKKTINHLQHTVAYQASLLDAIERSMAVIEFDPQGLVLRANDNFLNTLGYRAVQIEGQSHRMFCTPAFARSAEYSQLWSNLQKGELQSGTFERVASNGQSVWLEASYTPVRDDTGRVVKVVKYALDVTPRLQAESEANAKLEAIGRADRFGSLCLAEAKRQCEQQGALGKRDRHMRSPFVEVALRRPPF